MHSMFYEDMKKDLRVKIGKMAAFLGKSLNEEQLVALTEHLKFKNFQKNETVNNEARKKTGAFQQEDKFIRKGKKGNWKNRFSPELNNRVDDWIQKNELGRI